MKTDLCDAVLLSEVGVESILLCRQGVRRSYKVGGQHESRIRHSEVFQGSVA